MTTNTPSGWHGFIPRLLANTLGTALGVTLAMYVAYEYVATKIEQKVDAATTRIEAAGAKVDAKVEQMKANLLPHKP